MNMTLIDYLIFPAFIALLIYAVRLVFLIRALDGSFKTISPNLSEEAMLFARTHAENKPAAIFKQKTHPVTDLKLAKNDLENQPDRWQEASNISPVAAGQKSDRKTAAACHL